MDLRRLRTFVAVAELGTVSKAALQLRISQSALSRQVSELEQELRVRLFDRVGRRLVLTAVGDELLGDCRGVLGQVSSLGQRVELLRRGDSGVLKVAASPQMIESALSTFLPRYAARFPNVQVKLTEALGPAQVTLLERGEVHLGIRHDQGVEPWLASRSLPPDDILAAGGPSFHFGPAEVIDIAQLAPYPLLLLEAGYSVRVQFNAACRLANVKPIIAFESRAPHTVLALAEAGQGVAIIPSLLRTDRYALRIVRVTHRRKPLREGLVIQWDTRRPIPRYAESFREALAEYMDEVFPITQPSRNKRVASRSRPR
ncbi:MAG TPA: LysR family transcriptional regulator [Xanthobacteraceae bacterium]|nr:LysR family transcriptional regulator [Xanthobacteraceae bacterium]